MTSLATTAMVSLWLIGLACCGNTRELDRPGWDLVIVGASSGDTLTIDRNLGTDEIDGFILSTGPVSRSRSDALVVPCALDHCVVLASRLLCAEGTWHACVDLDATVACGSTMFVCNDGYGWEPMER